ncbi:aspartate carbamoyltransferase [Porphyromonas endodontalis]|uniref:Aspartate carbamoyltransferase n=1 Tax=Porphyromonas endodontalis (strain ATCC 35406 / DSM 24491 / JCM 8526 / CCUG 16442 / BCRC 14492 / NCTC 13058 / HG 370) TaxID=553175 RepID=C3JAD9_POREA|nr:aspartate carbamoyltransferase [Porphyromonas endodontalis]EEN82748.1 aspartate carbamoyltransferase [Porphyromonas endodontalis ATCC 35406]UBH65042.1 aspartate carbamoyltransferase [Porphyromonas endodontalis]SUB68355.1 Aspartate carbamoyltransferase catalytic chain [Porphyromonas endodontalis]
MKHLVSISHCSAEDIMRILDRATLFERNPNRDFLQGRVVATLFFEPSTRTRLSFETAVCRLGGKVIGFSDASTSSSTKGETLKDTIKIVSNYADAIVMRHYLEGAAQYATEVSPVPIINAGDGSNQHPSQTLLDLYSIRQTQGSLEQKTIVMVGDLKYGRTIHSLIEGMQPFSPRFIFVAPKELALPEEYRSYCREHNIPFEEVTEFTSEVIAEADILYMTRVQRERFSDPEEYERVKNVYILDRELLRLAKPNLKILHPLPRVQEIAQEVDDHPAAYYFRQALNGLYVRQSILSEVLGIEVKN